MKTPRPTSNGGSYHVHCSGLIFETLKQIQKQAKDEGRGEQVLTSMRRIWHELSYNPHDFGEPLYRLPGLGLQVCHAVVGPLLIYFAIHHQMPLVFIKEVALLPRKNLNS
jgi:hypothetical protein